MDPQTLLSVIERLRDLGAYGALGFVLYATYRGWFVPRWTYDALKADRDELKADRDNLLGIARRSLKVSEHVVGTTGTGA